MRSDGFTVEIYFNDLNQEAQYELTRLFGHNISCGEIIAEIPIPMQDIIIMETMRGLYESSHFLLFFLY